MTVVTRFAPSPTGPLHLGHAYSALIAHDFAKSRQGRFLLRIEDIDPVRSKPEWVAAIYEDLQWLSIGWESPVRHQSECLQSYKRTLQILWQRGVLYACTCNRRDIRQALQAPQEGALMGPDGLIYPGTCQEKTGGKFVDLGTGHALRLNMRKALQQIDTDINYLETSLETDSNPRLIRMTHEQCIDSIGDIVVARKGFGTSYHLSVVVDDADQEVTHVTRGQDLEDATPIHVILQRLLGLKTPLYYHHPLVRDDAGKRLAKRDDAKSIATYRAQGASPAEIRSLVGL